MISIFIIRKSSLLIALIPLLFLTTQAFADIVTVAHGDQFVIILENKESVKVEQTILLTSNMTIKGYLEENVSIDGTLVGKPTIIADSSVGNAEVLWKSEANVTTFTIRVNVTLEPTKFKAVKLSYYLMGLLERENDGSWLFNRVFKMIAGAIAPPEIVVKVPKPSQFDDLQFQEIVPTPSVLLEEGAFYVMSWKSSAVTFENTTETLVRLRYSSHFSIVKFFLWLTPTVIGVISGFVLTRLWDKRKEIKPWLRKILHSSHITKKII